MSFYRALTVHTDSAGNAIQQQAMLSMENLPDNDLIIQVKYSGLNHYDVMMLNGAVKPPYYPFVPGIDAAGVVVSSKDSSFSVGDEVIVTGFDLGSKAPGGLGGYISVPAGWAIRIPIGLNMRTAIAYGSAGMVAGIGMFDLINTGILPGKHKIAITDASCAMGAVATTIMVAEGYNITAFVSDQKQLGDYVSRLGADSVRSLNSLIGSTNKTVATPEFDGVFDTVGGDPLSSLINYINPNGTVVIGGCINPTLNLLLEPFMLSGLNIIGVNPMRCSSEMRNRVWQRMVSDWRVPQLDWLCTEISLNEVTDYIPKVLSRQTKGQIIVNHSI